MPSRSRAMNRSLVLAACLMAAAGANPAAEVQTPVTVKVKTSRGDFDLLVYAKEKPETGSAAAAERDGKPLVLLISGEGGWRHFDRVLAGWLADAGYFVGGVDAMDYFWEPQDDRQALASDFRAYVAALAAHAGRPTNTPLVLAGFSFGADLAPRLAGAGGWGGGLRGLLMIAPDEIGSLAFRLMEILGFEQKDHTFSVADALRDAAGIPVFFVHGAADTGSAAVQLAESTQQPKRLSTVPGADHHFSGREPELRAAVIDGLAWIEANAAPAAKP
ncbi:MAG TPA: AcvB/VirJ family lysyl-phosphatidylglycerol hydrolase [Candidatus Polarisedimenticolia bacterium]|nr:AcvB/VirJ family lysyl-phosphatidylglycerol hydrolase [Candidatus Polarisedimenticolia bacterium]